MSEPHITIQLAAADDPLRPGDLLSGHYQVHLEQPDELRAVEMSILWYTVGQGDEDFGIHHFERHARDDQTLDVVGQPRPIDSRLPNSPFSYQGVIVNLRWCVRVRLFLTRGRDVVEEAAFQLGTIPRAEVALDLP